MCFCLCNALTVLLSGQNLDYLPSHGTLFAELYILFPNTTFAAFEIMMDVSKALLVTLNRNWDRWRRSGTSSHLFECMAYLVILRRKIQKEKLQYLAVDVWWEVTSQFEDAGKNESYDETGDDTKVVSINHFSDRFYIID